jgi:hypothetical protein
LFVCLFGGVSKAGEIRMPKTYPENPENPTTAGIFPARLSALPWRYM